MTDPDGCQCLGCQLERVLREHLDTDPGEVLGIFTEVMSHVYGIEVVDDETVH